MIVKEVPSLSWMRGRKYLAIRKLGISLPSEMVYGNIFIHKILLHTALATIANYFKLLTLANSSADCWRSGVLKAYDPTVATTLVMVPTLARTFFWRSATFCSDALWVCQCLIINDIMWNQNLPTLPIMDTSLSSEGFPSLARTFFADSSDLNTPTTLIPAVSKFNYDNQYRLNFEEKTVEPLNSYSYLSWE